MITIISAFKPFTVPHIQCIQENALKSWKALSPSCQIILAGNGKGVSEIAKKYKVLHVPDIRADERGLPLISSLFHEGKKRAVFDLLCYVNGDIILMEDILTAAKQLSKWRPLFLGVARRWDLAIRKPIAVSGDWQTALRKQIKKEGALHGYSGIDLFLFPKETFTHIPDLVVGRAGWDNWMIFHARKNAIPVVDMTQRLTLVHQDHDAPGTRETAARFTDDLAKRNIQLAGGYSNLLTIRDANFLLTQKGLQRNWYGTFSASAPWRFLLGLKRRLT